MVAEIYLSSQVKSLGAVKMPESVHAYWKGIDDVTTAYYMGSEGCFTLVINPGKSNANEWEKLRKNGAAVLSKLPKSAREIRIVNVDWDAQKALAFAEGMLLADYRFDKYITKGDKLSPISLVLEGKGSDKLAELIVVCDAVKTARNWVNEPVNALNAQGLGEAFQALGQSLGFKWP
ncbi:MAG: hypothetical protein EBT66_05150 [Bacteroidetes bacterium]|nr:hypothetical protein [Bacteroidota bacterium]